VSVSEGRAGGAAKGRLGLHTLCPPCPPCPPCPWPESPPRPPRPTSSTPSTTSQSSMPVLAHLHTRTWTQRCCPTHSALPSLPRSLSPSLLQFLSFSRSRDPHSRPYSPFQHPPNRRSKPLGPRCIHQNHTSLGTHLNPPNPPDRPSRVHVHIPPVRSQPIHNPEWEASLVLRLSVRTVRTQQTFDMLLAFPLASLGANLC